MKEKTKKEKQGHARLFELAGARKNKLTLACLLSVLSSAARIVPFFTIYGVVVELLAHYTAPAEADQGKILALCAITSPVSPPATLPAPPRGPSKRLSPMTPTRLKRSWPTICAKSLRR